MMPGSFTDLELEDPPTPAPGVSGAAASAVQQALLPPQAARPAPQAVRAPPPPVDPLLEVQRRLDMAQCYQTLMSESFFSGDTEATRVVEGELHAFIQGRLKILVGIGAPAASPVGAGVEFSREEAMALKALARSVLGRKTGEAPVKEETVLADPPAGNTTMNKPPIAKRPSRARKPKPPPGFMNETKTPSPAAQVVSEIAARATGEVVPVAEAPSQEVPPQQDPPPNAKFSETEHTVAVVDEKGNITKKKIRLNLTQQVRPAGFTPARTPTKQEFETLVNAQAAQEAEMNARGFVSGVERAPTLPITRR